MESMKSTERTYSNYTRGYLKRRRHVVMLRLARGRARRKGLEFNLTPTDIPSPLPTHCPVFGIKLKSVGDCTSDPATMSLDRIDNSLGYVRGNVVIVSWRANWLKGNASVEELKKLAKFYSKMQN